MDINKQLVPVKNIAAIDLGSNSFHMIVAQLINKRFQIISRHKKRVHLASGLDNNKILSEEAMERGLDCLRLFAERIKDFEYKVNFYLTFYVKYFRTFLTVFYMYMYAYE